MTDGANPLHSKLAEQAVLGSMMKEPAYVGDVIHVLRRESFYEDAHQQVFKAIFELHAARKPIDAVTVADKLHHAKQIENIGGYGYLADLVTASGSACNVLHYCETVLGFWKRRQLVVVAQQMIADAHDSAAEPDVILSGAERSMVELSEQGGSDEIVWLHEATDAWLADIDDKSDRLKNGEDVGGMPTGFTDLDSKLGGGLYPGELLILAARPSVGKTALGLSIAYKIASQVGKKIAFFSLEQNRTELMNRLAAAFGLVEGIRIRDGSISTQDAERIQKISAQFRKTHLAFHDKFHQSILSIAANARRLKRRDEIAAIVIDYLQLVTPESRKEQRHEQVASMSRRLKSIARELEIPVICLAQINRDNQKRADTRPRMSDLRESGAIEQDADVVMLMHRPNEKDDLAVGEDIEIIIDKNRHGPTGTVTLWFEKALMRFTTKLKDFGT